MLPEPASAVRLCLPEMDLRLSPHEIIFDEDFPDPDVYFCNELSLYVGIATQSVLCDGTFCLGQAATSPDLVHWTREERPLFDQFASWAAEPTFYAGHTYVNPNGYYYHYYSTTLKKDPLMRAVSVAVSDHPTFGFRDTSKAPIVFGPDNSCIDPFPLSLNGQLFIFYGSAGYPIMRAPLSASGLEIDGPSLPVLQPIPADPYQRAPEGVYLFPMGGYLFMLTTGADCFGNGQGDLYYRGGIHKYGEYAITQARYDPSSDRFLRRSVMTGETDVLWEGDLHYKNPGNPSVVVAPNQQTYLIAHLIDRQRPYFGAIPHYPELERFNRRPMARTPLYLTNGWLHSPNGIFNPSPTNTFTNQAATLT